jgi:hypothetical protein
MADFPSSDEGTRSLLLNAGMQIQNDGGNLIVRQPLIE